MLSQMQGQLINVSNLAKSLIISSPATRNIISFFERSYILRLLTPLHANVGKRLIKAPKCYIRDSGTVSINDLQPGKAYYIIPVCPAPYELNDKIRVFISFQLNAIEIAFELIVSWQDGN